MVASLKLSIRQSRVPWTDQDHVSVTSRKVASCFVAGGSSLFYAVSNNSSSRKLKMQHTRHNSVHFKVKNRPRSPLKRASVIETLCRGFSNKQHCVLTVLQMRAARIVPPPTACWHWRSTCVATGTTARPAATRAAPYDLRPPSAGLQGFSLQPPLPPRTLTPAHSEGTGMFTYA